MGVRGDFYTLRLMHFRHLLAKVQLVSVPRFTVYTIQHATQNWMHLKQVSQQSNKTKSLFFSNFVHYQTKKRSIVYTVTASGYYSVLGAHSHFLYPKLKASVSYFAPSLQPSWQENK